VADEKTWTFPSAPTCEIKGLNDSGVETFRGDTIVSLAREICQNSLDAAIKPADGSDPGPVELEFSRFDMPRDAFPALEEFQDAMTRSAAFWKDNAQATRFFGEMGEVLASRTLKCLRISDFNTTGLTGVHERSLASSSAWRSLVMSSGVSDKTDISGGSFGIGKYAAFSCSQFRTVFYATKTVDGKEGFQGVSRLVTFETAFNEMALGTGYLGEREARPIPKWISPDTAFVRERPGTDIFIPAFAGGEQFTKDIVTSVLDGFLFAIWSKKLIVRINDGEQILSLDKSWLERAYRNNDELFNPVRHMYEVLKTPEGKWRRYDFEGLGYVRLALQSGKDLDKRIAMIRQPGMLIFKKGNFRSHISFTGVLIVEGDLNKTLREFENPQHNRWEENRSPQNKRLLQEIYDFCRDSIAEIVKEDLGEEIDSGLGDVLPDAGDAGDPRTEETLDVKIKGDVSIVQPKRKKRKHRKTSTGGKPTGDESGSDTHETERPRPTKQDDGTGGAAKVVRRDVPHSAFRSICQDKTAGLYRLKITPSRDAEKASVDVTAVAEIKGYEAPIKAAELPDGRPLKVSHGEIAGLKFQKNVPVEIFVTLDYSDYVSMEIDCYEYK